MSPPKFAFVKYVSDGVRQVVPIHHVPKLRARHVLDFDKKKKYETMYPYVKEDGGSFAMELCDAWIICLGGKLNIPSFF